MGSAHTNTSAINKINKIDPEIQTHLPTTDTTFAPQTVSGKDCECSCFKTTIVS